MCRAEERTAQPIRRFTAFFYRAGTWPAARWVVAKVEANALGTNRRFVVTNRPGAMLLPGAGYDEYGERGESENRHKEFKLDLHMGRLSDHRFLANYFRLYLHALAMNLLVRMRRLVALPLEPKLTGVTLAAVLIAAALPAEVEVAKARPTEVVLPFAEPREDSPTEESPAERSPAEVTSTARATVTASATAPAEVAGRVAVGTEVAVVPTEDAPTAELPLAARIAEVVPASAVREEADPATTDPGELVPTEALAGSARQSHFRRRRLRDVLGEGQPSTWRRLLIKAVAVVTVSCRGIVVRLSTNWPHLDLFRQTLQRLRAALVPIVPVVT